MKNIKTVGVVFLILISVLVLGCTDKTTEPKSLASVQVAAPNPITTTVVPVYDGDEYGTLTYSFKVGEEKMMFDRNIKLLGLATEDAYAILEVEGVRYDQVNFEVENEIAKRIMIVTDVDDPSQTAKIRVRHITSNEETPD